MILGRPCKSISLSFTSIDLFPLSEISMCCLNSIEFDDFGADPSLLGLEEGDSSDDDFLPSLHLRYVCILFINFVWKLSYICWP